MFSKFILALSPRQSDYTFKMILNQKTFNKKVVDLVEANMFYPRSIDIELLKWVGDLSHYL